MHMQDRELGHSFALYIGANQQHNLCGLARSKFERWFISNGCMASQFRDLILYRMYIHLLPNAFIAMVDGITSWYTTVNVFIC